MSLEPPLRLLLVDDEAPARWRLRALVQEQQDAGAAVTVAAEAGDADEALAALQAGGIDALLLDIALPGRDGLRLAEALRALPEPPAVVFVTAHAGHALRAFELDAVDYLTKPVRRDRLAEALARLQQRRGQRPAAAQPPSLVVQERGRLLRLPHDEVLVLRAEQKYVTLRTAQHSYVLDDSLAELEHKLGPGFLRIHRNTLVARRAVRALALRDAGDGEGEAWAVQVAPLGEWLAVSRRQLAAVRAALAGAGDGT